MKGCLFVLGFLVVGAALVVGAVVVVQRGGATQDEPLVEQATTVEVTKRVPEARGTPNRVAGASITYRYKAGDRSFSSSTWLPLSALRPVRICFDPDDPAVHTARTNQDVGCGQGNLGTDGVRRATEVGPGT